MKLIELEALRAFASIYVFLHHAFVDYTHCNIYIAKLFIFGQEAVMVFFLLSGYVISRSMGKNNYAFSIYFKHRFTRIYYVVIPSIIFSYFVFGYIYNNWSVNIQQLFLNLLMLQDKPELKPGVLVSPVFHNEPLWSLSYEWWFYMIFFIHLKIVKLFNQKTLVYILSSLFITLVGIVTYKLVFNQLSLFLMYYFIWATGASFYFIYEEKNLLKKSYYIYTLLLSYIIILLLYSYFFIYKEETFFYVNHPILEFRHYLSTFILILMLLIYLKLYQFIAKINFLNILIRFFAKFAPISFAFYLFHYPVMLLLGPLDTNGYLKVILMFLFASILSYTVEIYLIKKIKRNLPL